MYRIKFRTELMFVRSLFFTLVVDSSLRKSLRKIGEPNTRVFELAALLSPNSS